MERKLIIAGIGGQGVIFVTKVLSQAALARGESVMASENHGMSQRGGSVMSYVKVGGSEAPLIRRGTADALIAFDRVEAIRNLPFMRAGGKVCVNSLNGLEPAVMPRLNELGINVHTLNADACAKELGAPAVANLVVLGFAAAHQALGLTLDDLKEAVKTLGPAKAVEMNLKALEAGARKAALTPDPSPIRNNTEQERGE
ncbi:MAG: indolepyruvate oxidoreductase subunit beta [Chloroflexi bacterium]|nr:indolepyruvate oxidoreductase subunit beta [Chloroflexota bacterium]